MQRRRLLTRGRAGLAALALLAAPLAATSQAQGSEAAIHRAYYLEHEGGDLDEALALYREAQADRRLAPELRAKAHAFADALAEDLAAADLARLMPADAILYAELNRPGEQLGGLLAKLGLLKADGAPAQGLGISPALLQGALGLRGAALAVTAVDPRGGPPHGVAVLHPGDLELVRGLIETAVPAGGSPIEPIGGHPTWRMPDGSMVTLTSRLVVAGNDPEAVAGVVRRLHGEGGGSLAEHPALQVAMAERGRELLWFCVNPEPVMPMLTAMMQQQAQHDPQAAMAMSMLDIESLVGVAGRLAVDEEGLALDLSLHLEEGHQNLVFNLMRMPSVQRRTLELVPEGAAFFLATALNEPRPAAAAVARHDDRQPAVSMMDFGREVFGNLVDLAVFALPPEGQAQPGGMPDAAAILRVNDVARSKALWNLVLGMGSQAATGAPTMEPERVEVGGVAVEVYDMGHMPVFLAQLDDGLVISPSRRALQRTFRSLERRRSVLADGAFAHALSQVDESSTFAAMIHPGRCAALAQALAPPHEARQMAQFAPLLGDMVITLATEHSDTHAALRARVENLPDVSGFVNQMMAQQKGMAPGRTVQAADAVPAPKPITVATGDLQARFDELACERHDRGAAIACGEQLLRAHADDARALNNFAWALLTEPRYGQEYDELALEVSKRSNEVSGHDNWYYLDTLALACFRNWHVRKAVELEEMALERAAGSAGADEVRAALERYRAAAKGGASQ